MIIFEYVKKFKECVSYINTITSIYLIYMYFLITLIKEIL